MHFFKYQGTGNDFVLVDQRTKKWIDPTDQKQIEKICDRRFGIGADGLILLQNRADFDFEMVYFNADGRPSSMCGNGGRCIVAFAKHLKIVEKKAFFWATDGPHEANLISDFGFRISDFLGAGDPKPEIRNPKSDWVELKMIDVATIETLGSSFVLNTGSPHFVAFKKSVAGLEVFNEGRKIRNSVRFKNEGINVNFVEPKGPFSIQVLTYERGVEDETLSCGTGATAAALAFFSKMKKAEKGPFCIEIETKGGFVSVKAESDGAGGFRNIWLCGPAEQVFEGHF